MLLTWFCWSCCSLGSAHMWPQQIWHWWSSGGNLRSPHPHTYIQNDPPTAAFVSVTTNTRPFTQVRAACGVAVGPLFSRPHCHPSSSLITVPLMHSPQQVLFSERITWVYLDLETREHWPVIGCFGHMITWVETAAVCCCPAFLWREAGESLAAWGHH